MFTITKEKIKTTSTLDNILGCWLWNLKLDNGGYGSICIIGQHIRAHIACEAKYGRMIPRPVSQTYV